MLFPDHPRFIYQKNPLEFVICQVRFPTILKIDAQPPSDFQEAIRRDYPILRKQTIPVVPIPDEIKEALGIQSKAEWAYEFASEDGDWTISLTSDFLAITTRNYSRWENFREHFAGPYQALLDIYAPSFFTRVGLRYRDVIIRSELGLDPQTSWAKLLQPHIAGTLSDEIEPSVQETHTNILIKLDNDLGVVRIQHGLGQHKETHEQIYLIDSDFYTEERLVQDAVFKRLDQFNANGRRLFRWCITSKLHEAMEPAPID